MRHLFVEDEVVIVVAVIPEYAIGVVLDVVGPGQQWNVVLIRIEEAETGHALVAGEGPVHRTPRFVRGRHRQRCRRLDVEMDDGTVDLTPQAHGSRRRGCPPFDLDKSLAQDELLPEGEGVAAERVGVQPQAHAPELEHLIVFVECPAAGQVEEDVTPLNPDVAADIAAAERHRLGCVLALRVPDDVVLV